MGEDTPRKKKKRSSVNWLIAAGVSLILTAIVLAICFFLQGKTTVTGGWTESVETVAMSCEAESTNYPIFESATKGSVRINIIFGNEEIDTISLVWRAQYDNDKMRSDDHVKASKAMEKAFAAAGMGIDSLGVVYSNLDNFVFQMSLYAKRSDLNNDTYKFFMLNEISGGEYNLNMVKRIYKNKNLNCVVKE